MIRGIIGFFLILTFMLPSPADAGFEFKQNDRLVIIGNSFGERMGHSGYLETVLISSYPEKKIVVRNLSWSGDTPSIQLRPRGFPPLDGILKRLKPTVYMLCFGMNESFDGDSGLSTFRSDLQTFIASLKKGKYVAGKPRFILVSPIAHEDIGGLYPDGKAHNMNLIKYANAMKKVAGAGGHHFVDLYTPSLAEYRKNERKLTVDGVQLDDFGYYVVSQHLAKRLGILDPEWKVKTSGILGLASAALLARVKAKNFQFKNHWRAANGVYIYGQRKDQESMKNFPEEAKGFEEVLAALDKRLMKTKRVRHEEFWK